MEVEANGSQEQAPLAPGWTEHVSGEGVPYFYHEASQRSVWSRDEATEQEPSLQKDGEEVEDITEASIAARMKKLEEEAVHLSGDDSDRDDEMPRKRRRHGSEAGPVESAVQELSEERRILQTQLSTNDAILDPRCTDWVAQWLAESNKDEERLTQDVDHVIDMLASGYEGYAEYAGKLLEWIDIVNPGQKDHTKGTSDGSSSTEQRGPGDTSAVAHFKGLAMKEFQPSKVLSVIENGEDTPPKWLVEMLDSEEWRHLLISLADKHKSVPLLEFCVKAICKAGRHAEVSAVMNTAAYFAVFRRTFTDTLKAILDFSPVDAGNGENTVAHLNKLEEKFRELAGLSQYTYMFATEALEALETNRLDGTVTSKDLQLDLSPGARCKIRRLRQVLETMTRRPNETNRNVAMSLSNPVNRRSSGGLSASSASRGFPELASLIRTFVAERTLQPETFGRMRQLFDPECNPMAASMPVWPLRRVDFLLLLTEQLFAPFKETGPAALRDATYILAVATARVPEGPSAKEAEILAALEEALTLCKDKETLTSQGIAKTGTRIQRLAELVKAFPPVSVGVLRFARSLITSKPFQRESCYSIGVHGLLHLIRVAMVAHPLQRVMAFFVIMHSLPVKPPHIMPTKLLDLKQAMMDELVMLMQLGFCLEVLDFMRNQAERTDADALDPVLLRYFAINMARSVEPPFSPEFARAALHYVSATSVSRSIRSSHHSRELMPTINDLKAKCNAALTAKPEPVVPKASVEPTPGVKPRREVFSLVPFRPPTKQR